MTASWIPRSATSRPCSGKWPVLEELLKDPSKISALVFAMVGVAALVRRWVIPYGTHHDIVAGLEGQITKLTTERDEFKKLAFELSEIVRATQRVRGGGFVGRKDPS